MIYGIRWIKRDSIENAYLVVGDGSFCNRTLFRAAIERTEIIARARCDLKLCRQASGTGRFYDTVKFTPEQIRQNESLAWHKARLFHGGEWRKVRYVAEKR